jgi:integrase
MSVRKREWQPKKGKAKEVWVVDYKDLGGKRRYKSFRTKKKAEDYEHKVLGELRDGIHVPEKETITVADAGDKWILDCEVEHDLEKSTIDAYRTHLRLHIKPLIGEVLLTRLSIPAVKLFQDRVREKGGSADLVRRLTIDLGAIIAVAQERGYVARNVVYEMSRSTRAKKKRAGEKRRKKKAIVGVDIPLPEEIALLQSYCTDDERPFFLTLIFTAMRSSEIRALAWSAVDFEEHTISVTRRVDKAGKIGWPKTGDGQRKIPVPAIVINTLKEWKLRCPRRETKKRDAAGNPVKVLDLVFPNGHGKLENHGNIITRLYQPLQLRAGLIKDHVEDEGLDDEDGEAPIKSKARYPGLHAMRHFFASWCINRKSAGGLELPAPDVRYRMGHSSIQQTVDTYGHLFPDASENESLSAASKILLSTPRAT